MKIKRLLNYSLNIFIFLILIDLIYCEKGGNKRRKNQSSGSDYADETEDESPRSRGSQTENDYDVTERIPTNNNPGRGRGPPNKPKHQGRGGRGRNLAPGQVKKQQNRNGNDYDVTTAYYVEETRYPDRTPTNNNKNKNKNKNKPKPNRGNSSSNNNNNNQNNNDNDYDNSDNNNQNNNNNNEGNNRPNTHRPKPTPFPVTTVDPNESDLPLSEWRSLERLKHHWQNTAHTKSALSQKFIFWLEKDTDYQRHDACLTPDNALGNCHFVQHCPIPDVIRSFDKFLSFACFIRNRYVGICCPHDYLDPEETQSRPQKQTTRRPKPQQQQQQPQATTRRPHNNNNNNNRPNIPSDSNGSDGSDYNNGICGVSENTRIIGGALADPKDWLWMAALILKSQTKPYCGGALISNQHILTAAHCLRELTPDEVTIRLGAYDFSAAADPEAQDFAIEYFKIHPKYNRISNENDLAIIKLRSKTRFTEAIKPICLPQRNRNYAGQLGIVTGWGHTSFGGKGSSQLRQVSLPVWNNTQCDASYSIAIADEMLCAGNKNGGKDSCQGDSGGPLMLQGPNKRWMIIGVVSWGIKCGQPDYPGVYTRVSKYIDWIKTNTRDI